MKVESKIFANVFASILPQVINLISNFILPPLILSLYGSQTNGLISTVKTIVSYVSLVGAGISISTTQALYAPVAQGDNEKVKSMMKATSKMFNQCGWYYVIILFFISLVYPLFISGNLSYNSMFWLMIVMGISGASEFFVVGRCRSLLYADQKVYVCTIIQAFSLLISLICAILLLTFEVSIVIVQLAISLVYVLRAFLLHCYVRKYYPYYTYDRNTVPCNDAIAKRNAAMIHQLTGLVVTGSQTVILSMMVSLEAASIYAIYNIIFSGIYSICSNINSALTPFLGRSLALDSKERTSAKYGVIEYCFYVLILIVFGVTSMTIISFLSLYTKGADINYIYINYALLFIIIQVFNIFRLPCSAMINAAGHFKETKSRAITEAIICVLASIIFTWYCGMYGVLLGTGCALCWRCIDMIYYSHKIILDISILESIFRLFRIFLYVLLVYGIIIYLHVDIPSYTSWIKLFLISFLLMITITSLDTVVFERQWVKLMISNLLHK